MQHSTLDDIGTWSFSGVVVDGSTEKQISQVEISYVNNDGVVQSELCDENGKFIIDNIPYGERTFVFSYINSDKKYTTKRIVVSSYTEASSLGGVIGDVARIVRLYPLTGIVSGTLLYQPHGTNYQLPAALSSVSIFYSDSTMKNAEPASITAATDSFGNFKATDLPLAPGGVISFDNFKKNGITYTLASKTLSVLNGFVSENLGKLVFATEDTLGWSTTILFSNVLSSDGYGKTDVHVNDTIWYALPVNLQASSLVVSLNGLGTPSIKHLISRDTLFIIPINQLPYDTLIKVEISGVTTDGERFDRVMDGVSLFRTEKSPYPVESNFWSQPWILKGNIGMGETLWVRFSEQLDTTRNVWNWTSSSAASTVFGTGTSVNSKFRISGDTLFVIPDQRVTFLYNSTVGFNVQGRTSNGKYMMFYDFIVNTVEDPLYCVWTNTKDEMLQNRTDMGLRDTIKVLSSQSKFKVIGISMGDTGIEPPGLMLSDVAVSGDTIVYIPSLSLISDTAYSVDFDLQLGDGSIRRNVLPVAWSTKNRVSIVATDTKVNGMYRPLKAIGDSFSITFSEPIDTSVNAAVAFRVNLRDVKNVNKRTMVKWDNECRKAMITIIDTLPTADFDAPGAYTSMAIFTKAVESVTFDMVTKTGEQVLGCKPDGTPIALHTEKGMCIVQTNMVSDLDGRTSVEKDFVPVLEFPLDGVIEMQFSRSIDTSLLKMDSLTLYAGLQKAGAVIVPVNVSIMEGLTTLRIAPIDLLEEKTEYFVWIKGVAAIGISGAAAINKHSGTFNGTSASNYVLDRPFKTQ